MVLIIGWERLGMEFVFVSLFNFYSSYFENYVLANKRKEGKGFFHCTALDVFQPKKL